ncbi:DUF4399 domain-containing protein [[Empedobacter] haloabium]|uniref:DUF4399 domain-containing protein n=1 Tax=[Empedobacter] haloabium TaxID=592317 RepID=A0ABZ1UFP5_9BURK
MRNLQRSVAAGLLAALVMGPAMAQGPSVSFVEPKDGATVTSPFRVKFAIVGMEVQPAGAVVPNAGHHHLLINRDSIGKGQPIPFDDKHLHFGKGQTEAHVILPPGQYRLTMQFADGAHQSYGEALSKTISVTVK